MLGLLCRTTAVQLRESLKYRLVGRTVVLLVQKKKSLFHLYIFCVCVSPYSSTGITPLAANRAVFADFICIKHCCVECELTNTCAKKKIIGKRLVNFSLIDATNIRHRCHRQCHTVNWYALTLSLTFISFYCASVNVLFSSVRATASAIRFRGLCWTLSLKI